MSTDYFFPILSSILIRLYFVTVTLTDEQISERKELKLIVIVFIIIRLKTCVPISRQKRSELLEAEADLNIVYNNMLS